jgi:hypothetical protein
VTISRPVLAAPGNHPLSGRHSTISCASGESNPVQVCVRDVDFTLFDEALGAIGRET